MNENFNEQSAKIELQEFFKKSDLPRSERISFLKKLISKLGKKSKDYDTANLHLENLLDIQAKERYKKELKNK